MNCIDEFKSVLKENEVIIFEKVQSIYVQNAMKLGDFIEVKNTHVYISNLANMYIYNKESGFKHYYIQGNQVKRFKYDMDDNNVTAHIKNVKFKPVNNKTLFVFSVINFEISFSKKEFEEFNEKSKVLLFKGKDEIEKEKDSSVEENNLLSAENLYKLYEGNEEEFAALKGVSLDVNKGDFICVMGPSGSGKSTLIKLLSTMDEPSRGTVKFKGKNISNMTEKEMGKFRYENLGFIFQDFNLINNLTVKENISLPLILASKTQQEIDEKVNRIIKVLDIEGILNKYPYECSGGQNQRVACARALVTEPEIIMADEPTGNLDTKNSHELLKIFQKLNEEGITIVMVTHDNMIASYSKKLLFIRDGRIDDLLERKELSQKEYFYKIVDITSRESQALMDIL